MRFVTAVILLMITFGLAACGGNGVSNGNGNPSLSSTKAFTAFSFTTPAATGTINEDAKTITVNVPYGTNVTALVANFTTTGASVKVGSAVQTSGTTPNDFTTSIGYKVTAADGTTKMYSATVTVSPPAGGTLDMSFGIDGKATTAFGASFDGAYAATIQADGKIVAVGYSTTSTAKVFALARYNSNGTLDTDFGSGGKVTTAVGSIDDRALAAAIQADGKIVAVGFSNTGAAKVFALARYNTDGTLDTSFGTGGKVTTAVGTVDDLAYAIVIQTNGKIVTAGYSNTGTADVFALTRYNTDGTLDTSFGTGGKTTTSFGTYSDKIEAIAIRSDGKIVAAGYSLKGSTAVFALAQYSSNGILDTSFGSGGKVTTAVGTTASFADAIAIQIDGKIVAAGNFWNGVTNVFALARYNTDGTLDTSFGTGGITTTSFGFSKVQAFDVAIQPDGKLVAAGWSITGSTSVFALARYNIDGVLDPSFGTEGKLTTAFGSSFDYACDVAIQANGKIVTAGLSWTSPAASSFALAQYWP